MINELAVLEMNENEQTGGFRKLVRQQANGGLPGVKLEMNVERFATEDENIMMALGIGNFVNFAIRDKRHSSGKNSVYISCFAQNKKFTKISENSYLENPGQIVMYDEIFMKSLDSRFLKLNLVNNIPVNVFKRIMELYKSHIKFCA